MPQTKKQRITRSITAARQGGVKKRGVYASTQRPKNTKKPGRKPTSSVFETVRVSPDLDRDLDKFMTRVNNQPFKRARLDHAGPANSSSGHASRVTRVGGGALRNTSNRSISRVSNGQRTTSSTSTRNVNVRDTNLYKRPNTFYPHQKDALKIAVKSVRSMNLVLLKEKHPNGALVFRGGLIAHSTGSGKTVVSLGIVMEYLKLHESLRTKQIEGPYICIVTLKSNKDQNGLERYLKNLQTHYPKFVESMLPGLQQYEETARMKQLRKEFESRVQYFSFIEFASCPVSYTHLRAHET